MKRMEFAFGDKLFSSEEHFKSHLDALSFIE